MCRIPCVVRVSGRYVYRRRVHFQNIISKPLALALQTADPKVARRRAAFLSARFAIVKLSVETMLILNQALSGPEIEAIFRQELEAELTRNLHDAYQDASWSSSVAEAAAPLAEAYRIARQPDRPRKLSEAERGKLKARGLDHDAAQIDEYLRNLCHEIPDEEVRQRLTAAGLPDADQLIPAARGHMLRARADAWLRTTRIFDDDVVDAANPLQALVELNPTPTISAAAPFTSATPDLTDCPFVIFDDRRFSDGIDEIIAQLKQEKIWKGDPSQQRRIMGTFAWITGDKQRGAYNHLDVDAFKRGLMRLPKTFSFGTFEKGAMSRPFAEVVAELPPLASGEERHAKTVNRDLSTMSRVSKHLAQTVWKPKGSSTMVLDFAAATLMVKDTGEDPRPPWTKEHMTLLFTSPLYTGGGAALHRLDGEIASPAVWHDAAYWVPLLCYYHHTCREETCGLRVDEIHIDHDVPHFEIKDNDVRGRDGELAGEKRLARRRKLPLHDELIRLGFLDYVRTVRAEGHVALFPELYLFDGKRGGAQFYARTWTHLVDWIGCRMALPRNASGKGPDMHSIRALGSSFYEIDGVSEIVRADVMGHARATVNGKSYSKRLATEGLTTLLGEHKEFIARYVPTITSHVKAARIRLLPLNQRSRVGSARSRKIRSDAGTASRRSGISGHG